MTANVHNHWTHISLAVNHYTQKFRCIVLVRRLLVTFRHALEDALYIHALLPQIRTSSPRISFDSQGFWQI
jgi:hypothetical protein